MITTCTGCQTRYRLDANKVPHRLIRVRCPQCRSVFKLDGIAAARVEQPHDRLDLEPFGGDVFGGSGARPAPSGAADLQFETGALPGHDEVSTQPASPAAEDEQPGHDEMFTQPASPAEGDEQSVHDEVFTQPASPAAEDEQPVRDEMFTQPAAQPAAGLDPDLGGGVTSEAGRPTETTVAVAEESPRRRRRRDKEEMLARALVSDILVYNREARDKAIEEGNLLEALGPEIKKSWELYKEKVTAEVANNTNYFRDALNEILAEGRKLF